MFSDVPEVYETVLISSHSFFFILLLSSYFQHLIFQLTYSFFCLSYFALIPSSVFFISVVVLLITLYSLVLLGPC